MNNILNEKEIDLVQLSKKIFNDKPQKPFTYHLLFENYELLELFNSLVKIFLEGMKILYGNENGKVDIQNITLKEIQLRVFN